ncbi:hypothetical protein CK203_060972 [Vitis vinifera]|uniref:DUF4283 domain-containing protein n=1 Tax=Vitis vinifera TaxID=29760 RepID=A0A438G9B1_VITVI|nr:hypothetical protein CK203_060972 [Vitis vinifera]
MLCPVHAYSISELRSELGHQLASKSCNLKLREEGNLKASEVSCASNALLGLHQYLQGFVHSALMTFALYPLTHAQPWMLPLCYMALRPCVSASKANQHLDIYSGSMLSLPNVTPRDMWYGTLALVETKGLLMHYGHDTWHEKRVCKTLTKEEKKGRLVKVWKEEGRKFKLERRENGAGRYILCSVVDVETKRFCLVFPEGKGLLGGWVIFVGGRGLRNREEGLGRCLVGRWDGGRWWRWRWFWLENGGVQQWNLKKGMKVLKLGGPFMLLEFKDEEEAERVLKRGTRRFKDKVLQLERWSEERVLVGRKPAKEVWVGWWDPASCWNEEMFKRIGDYGGFVERLPWISVVVLMKKLKGGEGEKVREEWDVGSHAGSSSSKGKERWRVAEADGAGRSAGPGCAGKRGSPTEEWGRPLAMALQALNGMG